MPTFAPHESPDDRSYAEVEAAVTALADAGDGAAARARLLDFIGQHPASAEAHNDLGVLVYNAGEVLPALAAIDRAVALRPDCARYHRNRALVLLTKGDLEATLVALARSLSLDPQDEETLRIITDIETLRRQRK